LGLLFVSAQAGQGFAGRQIYPYGLPLEREFAGFIFPFFRTGYAQQSGGIRTKSRSIDYVVQDKPSAYSSHYFGQLAILILFAPTNHNTGKDG
jgi:hypothetical protein